MSDKRGGHRDGAGRHPNELPSHRIVVHATDDELETIMALSPRERTERMTTMSVYDETYSALLRQQEALRNLQHAQRVAVNVAEARESFEAANQELNAWKRKVEEANRQP